jgi:hypothetical protein
MIYFLNTIHTSPAELIGWIGTFSYLSAYLLMIMKRLSPERKTYHALNALGGICLAVNAVALEDMPNLIVNLIWMMIAVFAIYKVSGIIRKGKT